MLELKKNRSLLKIIWGGEKKKKRPFGLDSDKSSQDENEAFIVAIATHA